MKTSRGRLLAAGAAAGAWASIGVLRYPGAAAQFSYKLGNDQTATHPMTVRTIEAADKIRDETNGQLDVRVFPNSVLGGDTDMLAQTRSGACEFMQVGANILANVVPVSALVMLPFVFTSAQQMIAAVAGDFGTYLTTQTGKAGLRRLAGSWYGGTFQTQTRAQPINTPADFKGLKIRVPPGPIDVAVFKAFGAVPATITLGEVYTSLQTHLVDAIEVPLITVENFKYYELVKYISLTNHIYLDYLLVANPGAWQRLPTSVQDVAAREFSAAAAQASADMTQREGSIATTLRGQGMIFNTPVLAPFRQAIRAAGLYATWSTQYDPQGWSILEQTTGKLT